MHAKKDPHTKVSAEWQKKFESVCNCMQLCVIQLTAHNCILFSVATWSVNAHAFLHNSSNASSWHHSHCWSSRWLKSQTFNFSPLFDWLTHMFNNANTHECAQMHQDHKNIASPGAWNDNMFFLWGFHTSKATILACTKQNTDCSSQRIMLQQHQFLPNTQQWPFVWPCADNSDSTTFTLSTWFSFGSLESWRQEHEDPLHQLWTSESSSWCGVGMKVWEVAGSIHSIWCLALSVLHTHPSYHAGNQWCKLWQKSEGQMARLDHCGTHWLGCFFHCLPCCHSDLNLVLSTVAACVNRFHCGGQNVENVSLMMLQMSSPSHPSMLSSLIALEDVKGPWQSCIPQCSVAWMICAILFNRVFNWAWKLHQHITHCKFVDAFFLFQHTLASWLERTLLHTSGLVWSSHNGCQCGVHQNSQMSLGCPGTILQWTRVLLWATRISGCEFGSFLAWWHIGWNPWWQWCHLAWVSWVAVDAWTPLPDTSKAGLLPLQSRSCKRWVGKDNNSIEMFEDTWFLCQQFCEHWALLSSVCQSTRKLKMRKMLVRGSGPHFLCSIIIPEFWCVSFWVIIILW